MCELHSLEKQTQRIVNLFDRDGMSMEYKVRTAGCGDDMSPFTRRKQVEEVY
jgi:hypothetical protein